MAATSTELMVRLVADTKGFAAELGAASRSVETLNQKAVRMGTAMQDVGRRMTLGFTLPFVAGMGLAVKAASDLEEQTNKVDVVFGKSAKEILRWGESSARSFGMSRAEAYGALGTFGNLFRSMDIGVGASSKMSKGLVQLAADLASFNNASPEEALLALRAGLVGEIEPLRRFGVSLSQARIEAKALEMGLWDGEDAISAAAKAQAAYAIILDDTTLAQGDFARTSDSAANRMRIAKAELTDAAASIGSVVLPIFAKLVGVVSDAAQFFANLPGPVKEVLVVFGTLAAAMGPLLWITGSVVKNVALLAAQFPRMMAAIPQAGIVVGLAAAFYGLAQAIGLTSDISSGVSVNIEELTKHKKRLKDTLRELNDELRAENRFQREWEALGPAAIKANSEYSWSVQKAHSKVKDLVTQTKELAEASPTLAREFIAQAEAAGLSEKIIARLNKVTDDAEQVAVKHAKAARTDADRIRELGDEATGAATDIAGLKDEFDRLMGAQLDVEQATINMDRAIEDLSESVRNGTTDTLEGRQAFLDAKTAIFAWGEAVYQNAITAGRSTSQARDEQIAALQQVAGTLDGPLRDALNVYIWQLASIPRNIETQLSVNSQNMMNQLAALGLKFNGIAVVPMAEGAIVNKPTIALIGEAGPEAVVPLSKLPGNSPVMTGGGGGDTITATFNVYTQASDGDQVVAALTRWVQSNGAVPARVKAAFS